ncbi:MAG TPA: hypothetical protein VME86_06215 [Acidobacteriaceae bacterium]|nr:hypothetical protein [Acidobacteriaceae bacterium]
MLSPTSFVIAFVLAAGLLVAGVYLVRRPERALAIFSSGQVEQRFGVRFFRGVGWFYIFGGALGVVLVLAAAVVNFGHLHGR